MTTPLKLALVITADAKGVAPATGEARREVASVGQTARETAASIGVLDAANDKAAASAKRATDAARGQATAERDLREAVNRFAGMRTSLNDNQMKQRGEDIAAYGAELDRLRGKFNPVFGEIVRYKAAQAEIRQAHAFGAISIDEMTAALDRERSAALASIAALKGRQAALGTRGGMAGGGAFNTSNIAAQFQDIGVTSAMGMSPMQIALQQGTQLSAVFEQMRASGQSAGAGIAAAMMSVISPVSLITIAVVGLSAAAIQAFSSMGEEVKSVDDALAEHKQNIQALAASYGVALGGAQDYARESRIVLEAAARESQKALEKSASTAATSFENAIGNFYSSARSSRKTFVVDNEFKAFAEPIDALRRSIAAGDPDFARFQQRVKEIASTNPGELQSTANTVLTLGRDAAKAQIGLDAAARAIDGIGAASAGQLQIVKDFAAALRSLSGIALPNLSDREEALRQRTIGINRAGNRDEREDVDAQYRAAVARIEQQEADARIPLPTARPNVEMEGLPKVAGAGSRKADPYSDILKSADARIAQLRTEISLTGRVGVEADAFRIEQEMLAQATSQGVVIGEKQTREFKARAQATAELNQQLAKTRLEQDLMFEREQMFRSPTEQRVASTLRGAGIDATSADGERLAGQIRLNAALETGRELAGDFTSTLFSDLQRGVGLVDALTNAFGKLGDRLLQMALDAALDGLFAKIAGALGGGFASGFPAAPAGGGYESGVGLYARGGAFANDNIARFARGSAFANSIVDRPTLFSFARGTQMGEMGEAGPEAILPLKRNAAGQLGVASAGGGGGQQRPMKVEIHNHGNNEVTTKQSDDGSTLEVMVRAIARDEAASHFDRALPPSLEAGYGISQKLGRRS